MHSSGKVNPSETLRLGLIIGFVLILAPVINIEVAKTVASFLVIC